MPGMNRAKAEKAVARVPLSTVLVSIAGLWLCYFLLITIRGELLSIDLSTQILWRRVLATFIGALITVGLWVILRPFDGMRLWKKIVAALIFALPAALLTAQTNRLVFADLQAEWDEQLLREFVDRQDLSAEEDSARVASGLADLAASATREQVIELTGCF